MSHESIWIDNNAALAAAAQQWAGVSCMGIDTEFMREKTFFPLPGLIQMSDGERVWLIDPLDISDWSPLAAFFTDHSVLKLLHSGSEDMELFAQVPGAVPSPLLDTQTGAALAGLGAALSYQALVAELAGVDLEKSATRSDWLRRPLSEHQLRYAALDVLYLPGMRLELEKRLIETGRLTWWQEEGSRDVQKTQLPPAFDGYYRRVKGVSRLPHAAQYRMQKLCAWREQQARKRDLPRGWLVRDSVLLIIAREGEVPVDLRSELKNPREMPGPAVLKELSALLAGCTEQNAENWPKLIQPSDNRTEKARLSRIRSKVDKIAGELGVAAETLASRKDIQAALEDTGDNDMAALSSWKESLLADVLAAERAAS